MDVSRERAMIQENEGQKKILARCNDCHHFFTTGTMEVFEKKHVFCTNRCVNNSQKKGILKEKKEKIFLEKYGEKNPFGNEDIRKKISETIKKKFGVDNVSQSKEIKKKKERTSIEHFGTQHPQQSEEIREKTNQTCIQKYGIISYLGTRQCKEDAKLRSLETYGVDHPMKSKIFLEKFQQNLVEKYGVDNALKIPNIVEKIRQTCMQRYGVDNAFKMKKSRDNFWKWFHTSLERLSSKIENEFYNDILLSLWKDDEMCRQKEITISHKKIWLIDFYIIPCDLYIQFDGVFWHSDSHLKNLLSSHPNSHIAKAIKRNIKKDEKQNAWFKKKNLNLLRITDEKYKNDPKSIENDLKSFL